MISTVLVLSGITLGMGWLLLSAHARLKGDDNELIDAIDALLPQTQCAQCGYPGCRPYAEAVAAGAAIDLCPPGGNATFEALGALLGRSGGVPPPAPQNLLARIREEECIGCFLCTRACPVDAIIGAPGYMHTVIEAECTGCELCLPACPVDCIDLLQTGTPTFRTPTQKAETPKKAGKAETPTTFGTPTRRKPLAKAETPTTFGTPTPRKPLPDRLRAGHRREMPMSARPRAASPPGGAPCIGCNRCEPVCPAGLAPRELLWLTGAGKWDGALDLGLDRCIECRLCDRACPSGIPLARLFEDGKRVLAVREAGAARAAHAKARFDARTARLDAERDAAGARRRERLAARLARRKGARQPGEAASG